MITKRLGTVALVLLVGFGSVFLLPKSTKSSPAGIAMTLPNNVGDWIGTDAPVTEKEREVLAKDTEFARKTYTNLEGDSIYVSIVMSGDDMTNSIHRPERCLPAQGWNLQGSEKRVLPIVGGGQLAATQLHSGREVQRTDQTRGKVENLSYYWFVGYNDVTASHLARTGIDLRDRILYGYNQRWAYVTVAAIVTKGWVTPQRSETETVAILEKFIQQLAPQLQRPDGSMALVASRK